VDFDPMGADMRQVFAGFNKIRTGLRGDTMNAVALHASNQDGGHLVALGDLRVLIFEKDGEWLAQGVEIDYAASGSSLEDAQRYFELGLARTVHLHLSQHATIDRLLHFAPESVWKPLKARHAFNLGIVTAHDLGDGLDALQQLPFERIVYLQERHQGHAAAA